MNSQLKQLAGCIVGITPERLPGAIRCVRGARLSGCQSGSRGWGCKYVTANQEERVGTWTPSGR